MKKCEKCGYMNNQSNNFCINCGSKLTDKKTKYFVWNLVLTIMIMGLNTLSYFALRDFQFESYSVSIFEFSIFNFIPSSACIFSVIYHIILLKSQKLSEKYEKKIKNVLIPFFIGAALSLPSIALSSFLLCIKIIDCFM